MSDWMDSLVLMCVFVVDAEFCAELRKHHRVCSNRTQEKDYALVAPDSDEMANRQAETANKVILTGLKYRLQDTKGAWANELLQVLWAYQTTPHFTIRESPFRLAYGMEAIIPIEIAEESPRVVFYNEGANIQVQKDEFDLLPKV
ncbi:uncharacterized protein [Arachis hypogaea]|uniref:uncharacterized protein n=1 Tax=Arachis hypogaea TaxID=3818 RepID=UPI000DEC356A|nr:uncharacterized protein LOC112779658 [Arachis hypogaea]